jgi:hypothetical protein
MRNKGVAMACRNLPRSSVPTDAHRETSRRTRTSESENCVEMCKVPSEPPTNIDVYGLTLRGIA